MRGLSLVVAGLATVALPGIAGAQDLEGAKPLTTAKPPSGFVDDWFAFDGAGGRLLWINADAAARAEIRVVDLAQGGAQLAAVDISKFTLAPLRAHFVLDGNSFFVVAAPAEADGPVTAALIDGTGKVVRSFGPANDIVLREGARTEVITYARTTKPGKKGGPTTTHRVTITDLATGKRRINRELAADESGLVAKLDFRITAFLSDYTRAVGVKGGHWDKKEDTRTPDVEAWYSLDTGKFEKTLPITDLMGQAKKAKLFADHPNADPFLMVADDLTSLLRVSDGVPQKIDLAQPFHHYDHKSLQVQPGSTAGSIFFTFTIDPVNADAVARKKAVTEWVDLYELKAGETKAVRRARVKKTGNGFRFRATATHWALLPRHVGFSRGGAELRLFTLN